MSHQHVIETTKPSQSSLRQPFEYRLVNPIQQTYQLPEVWQLVASNLAAMGDVTAEEAMSAAKNEYFDLHTHTRVVNMVHCSGHLAGTFSITMDSEKGMPVTYYFGEELALLRQAYRLINGWRFSMSPHFRSGHLRKTTMALFMQLCWMSEADAFVIYYNERLQRYYDRQFNGRVIAEKTISFDGQYELPVRLMLCEAADNQPDPAYIQKGENYENALVF